MAFAARGFRKEVSQLLAVTGSGELGVGDGRGAGWALQGPGVGWGQKQHGGLTLQLGLDFLKTLAKQKGKRRCLTVGSGDLPTLAREVELTRGLCLQALGLCQLYPSHFFPGEGPPQGLNIPNTTPPPLGPLLLGQWPLVATGTTQALPRALAPRDPNGQAVGASV